VTLFNQKPGDRPQHEIIEQPRNTMHKTSYDLTKWIGDLKNNDLSVFLFNKTLVFDDLSYALTEKYQVEQVLTKDISIGAGSHHS
jgi:hypothetical protein